MGFTKNTDANETITRARAVASHFQPAIILACRVR
jgi:hypothetical protein